MSYTKMEFGARLREQVAVSYDVVKLARWAHHEFLNHCNELEPGLQPEMMRIIAMEEGPEFELTEQEIRTLANELQK
jgi:hypothetical protein